MKTTVIRLATAATDAFVRLFAPDLARLDDRCKALQREGEDLRAALAGELPADHPMSRYIAAWRRAHTAGGAR